MNIEVFTIAYNEGYLLPFFLQHYFSYPEVTAITIYDNHSTDNSPEIISRYRAEHPERTINVIPYDSGGEIRDDLYNGIKNACWRQSKADWVIVCDMDEFLTMPVNYVQRLTEIAAEGWQIIKCTGYEMVSEEIPVHGTGIIHQVTHGVAKPQHNKPILFIPDPVMYFEYLYGAHDVRTNKGVLISNGEFKMLHYKFLSLEYVLNIYRSRAQRLSNFNKDLGVGLHYTFPEEQVAAEYNNLLADKQLIII